MKLKETIQKTRPIANGLYIEVYGEFQPPVKAPDLHPTPFMEVVNFKKFVTELKLLAARAEKIFKNARQEFKFYNGALVNYSVHYGFGGGNWDEFKRNCKMSEGGEWRRFFDDYKKFRERYKDFFSRACVQHDGREYLNLDFWPRKKGTPQTLFTAFSNALFIIHGITRLKKGRDKKTAAIETDEWAVVEKLRRKGRGTQRGSVKFCAETVHFDLRKNSRGPTSKRSAALRQDIYRQERRDREAGKT